MATIKVVLADKQVLTRTGLQTFIKGKKDLKLLDSVENKQHLMQVLKKEKPQVLVVDYNLKDFITLDDLAEVRSISKQTKMLVISSDSNKQNIFKALETGVNGYVTKECSQEEIVGAIYATAKGEKFFCNKVLDLILEKHLSKEEEACLPTELTLREIEIVKLIARGHSAKKIANELHLSHHTVYTHRKNVMKKLALSSTADLMLYAVKTGIISA